MLNDNCPNCLQPGETASNINLWSAEGRVQLSQDCVKDPKCWMEKENRKDPKLAYWLVKCIVMR